MSQDQKNDQVSIVFYSKLDETSQKIKNKLKKEHNVRTLCVDNKIVNKSILADTNYNVRQVPAILTINHDGEDTLTQGDEDCHQFVTKLNKQKLKSMQKPSIFDTRLQMSSSQIAANPALSTQQEQGQQQFYQDEMHHNESSQSFDSTTSNLVSNTKLSPKELADRMMKERGL